ncbi:hypothetical protein NDU88_005722 [Pleurodeles waltl]|uniref:Uncharacterized protein n=1 Tax=Pleurodeles waltl TaxID=8319 RepID=A0AAV7PHM7_PLEWA|nr:hypothetical protein NDU88_005722 [Pleurodeles waltl]
MAAEAKVQQALRLLEEAGRLDLRRSEAAEAARPVRRAASGVAAAVLACSPPCCESAPKKEVSARLKGKAQALGGRERGRGRGKGVGKFRQLRQAPIKKLEVWLRRGRPRYEGQKGFSGRQGEELESSGDDSPIESTSAGSGRERRGAGSRLSEGLLEDLYLPVSSPEGALAGLGDSEAQWQDWDEEMQGWGCGFSSWEGGREQEII